MAGTRFLVLRMKDLIRIGAIVLVAIVLLVLALVFLVPSGGNDEGEIPMQPAGFALFTPGTYSATIVLNNKPVEVSVTVTDREILEIHMSDMAEIQQIFFPLFEPRMEDLTTEILRYQSAFIRPSTDYPVTTGILQQAVISALELAWLH